MSSENKLRASFGSFVNDIDSFDSSSFRISKAEASKMSPQQRILLECSFMTFKDAGYTLNEMQGLNCGVFVGMAASGNSSGYEKGKSSVYDATGTAASIATGRISYVFDFKGPNSAFDTACSSLLVALNAAVLSLQSEVCKAVLVAGIDKLFD